MAVASLVCSLVGPFLCGTGTVLGLIFGFIGLHQIKSSGQQGRSMAIAGIIVSALTIVAGVIMVIAVTMAAQENSRRHRHNFYFDFISPPAAAISMQSPAR